MRLQYFSSGPRERVLDAVLAAGHEVAGVYATDPAARRKWCRRCIAQRPGAFLSALSAATSCPDWGGSSPAKLPFRRISPDLPARFLVFCRSTLNVHGTLLPDYPGRPIAQLGCRMR